jgi:ComF family protein
MRLAAGMSSLCDAMLAVLYPQACAVCGASVEARADGTACAACWSRTRIFGDQEPLCWKCGVPGRWGPGGAGDQDWRALCRRCDPEAFTAARAIGLYEGALRAAVLALKREPRVARRLAQLMCQAAQRPPLDQATRIIPVPLHPARERERGFNQAAVLGRTLAASARLPFDERSLIRTVYTARHRAGMDARSRRESVEAAFLVQRRRLIADEKILLIDDVFTTGATVSACARALLDAGAQTVYVLTVARAGS